MKGRDKKIENLIIQVSNKGGRIDELRQLEMWILYFQNEKFVLMITSRPMLL